MATEVSRIDRPLPPKDPHYPESDGKPMGETGLHVAAIFALHGALRDLFAGREDVYVASDMFLYYEEGNPKANKSPDVMVIFGVENYERRIFKTWIEGTAPAVIFEVASEETYREDLTGKRDLYARLGVAEYFLFDPEDLYLRPRLQGLRLADGRYVPIPPDPDGGLISLRLGVRMFARAHLLRLIDLRTGDLIPTSRELAERAHELEGLLDQREALIKERDERLRREEERHRQERARADALADEVARLRRMLGDKDAGG